MSSRLAHRFVLFRDRDILHAAGVATAACVLSAGLVYVGYAVHAWRVARRAPCNPGTGTCILLFGKHAPQGRPDPDFSLRLERMASLWRQRVPQRLVLLGGGPPGVPSEAEVARDHLLRIGLTDDGGWVLESASRDTLQNLRNARQLLQADAGWNGRVTLLSSRYHLARCALFARQLGLDAELCAAETRFTWHPRNLWRLAGEAGYLCLSDIGTRWARLIGSRRMLKRVT